MKTVLCLGVLAMLVGCDASKAELTTTKATLSDVTHERDSLKTQVATLQEQLATTKGELAKEKAAESAANEKPNEKNGKTTMAAKMEPAAAGSGHSAHKKKSHKS